MLQSLLVDAVTSYFRFTRVRFPVVCPYWEDVKKHYCEKEVGGEGGMWWLVSMAHLPEVLLKAVVKKHAVC